MFAAIPKPADPANPRDAYSRRAVSADLVADLYEILDATMLLLDAQQGNIQVYDPVRDVLEIVAHRGLPEEFLQALRTVSRTDETASARALRTGKRVIIENVEKDAAYAPYRHVAAQAGYRAVQATPMLGHDGQLLGVLATELAEARSFSAQELRILDLYSRQAADAVERARVERDLDTARRRLEAALNAGEIGVYDWDMLTDQVYGDTNFERMFGVKLDEYGSAPRAVFESLIHPDDRERRLKRINQALQTGEQYESEYRIVLGSSTRWVISRGRIERDDANTPVRFIGVLLDITARRKAEVERQEISDDRDRLSRTYESLLSGIEDFAYVFDRSGRFLYANPPLLRLYARTLDQVVGKTFNELGYEQHSHDRHLREISQVIETRLPFHGEIELKFEHGDSTTYDYIFSPVLGPDNEVEVVVGITRDVTERKRSEEALREMDRQKNAFLAQLAHELRNPLAPIRNAARIFAMKQSSESDVLWASQVIDRQVDHLTRLIDDLLDVSRISRNKLELRRQRIELQEVVRRAVEISRPTIDQNGHTLILDLSPEPVYLLADMARLTQALMNLIINAAKYTDAGGKIELGARREGDEAVLRVKDNGIGMDATSIPKLFEMFYQADASLDRSQGGLGIGLSLVKSVVELHGGTVQGRSAGLGKGSEFIVRVPALTPTAQQVSVKPVPAAGSTAPSNTRRVLVVDDNRDGAESLAMFLQIGGHDVRTAYDGEEAVSAAETFRPEIVLLDIGMPKLNGYDACRRIRESDWGRNMVLIAQTGWGQEEDKRRTKEAGFDDHLVKPVDPMALMKMVAEAKRP
ncbi:MAG TPA: ATP-binding protein [Burkholderiales bacterium]